MTSVPVTTGNRKIEKKKSKEKTTIKNEAIIQVLKSETNLTINSEDLKSKKLIIPKRLLNHILEEKANNLIQNISLEEKKQTVQNKPHQINPDTLFKFE
jgi:stress-induced morphogen